MTARIWDLDAGGAAAETRRFVGHAWAVNSAAFHPGGAEVITASDDGTVRIWNVADGKGRVLHAFDRPVRSAAFSSDGARRVTVTEDRKVRVWDTRTGRLCSLFDHPDQVTSAAFSGDGARLVTASIDGIARIWDVVPGEGESASASFGTRKSAELRGHDSEVTFAAFGPDGKEVVTASTDRTVRIWSAWHVHGAALFEKRGEKILFSFSTDRSRIAVTDGEDPFLIAIWDTVRGEKIGSIDEAKCDSQDKIKSILLSPDGRLLAAVHSVPNVVRLWNVETAQLIHESAQKGTGDINDFRFSPDSARTLCAYGEAKVSIQNVSHPDSDAESLPHPGGVALARFNARGERIVTVSRKRDTIRVWDAASGDELASLSTVDREMILSASPIPSGDSILTLSHSGIVRVRDASTGENLALLSNKDAFARAEVSPSGQKVVTLSKGGAVEIWDFDRKRGFSEGQKLGPRGEAVQVVALSPCGKRLLSSANTGTTRIWDLATGAELITFRDEAPALFAGFAPRGVESPSADIEWIVILSQDGTLSWKPFGAGLLAYASKRKPRELTLSEKNLYALESAIESDARRLVDAEIAQSNDLLLAAEQIKQSAAIDAALRRTALDVISERAEDPFELFTESWHRTRTAGETPSAYRRALTQAQRACSIDGRNGTFQQALGAALYRTGDHEGALAVLEPFLDKRVHDPEGGYLAPLAFCALAHWELGHRSEAARLLEELKRAMDDPWESRFDLYTGLLNEAEALIGTDSARGDREAAESTAEADDPIPPIVFEYASCSGEENTPAPGGVMLCDLRTGEFKKILERETMTDFAFLPSEDGRRLYYTYRDGATSRIAAIDLLGQKGGSKREETLLFEETDCEISLLRHRPDDYGILFGMVDEKNLTNTQTVIYRIDRAGNPEQQPRTLLGRFDEYFGDLHLAPDRTWACFIHWPGKKWTFSREVWTARRSTPGGELWCPRRLTFDDRSDRTCQISPDGAYIYWTSYAENEQGRILRIGADGRGQEVVYAVDSDGELPVEGRITLSRSGLVAFAATEGEGRSIVVVDSEGRVRYCLSHRKFGENMILSSPFFLEF